MESWIEMERSELDILCRVLDSASGVAADCSVLCHWESGARCFEESGCLNLHGQAVQEE
jgi:hypothetical protein